MHEQMSAIRYLIVPLSTGATSFCYYENPAYYSGDGDFLPLTVIRSIHDYAAKKNIAVNFIYGNKRPPREYEEIIESTSHVKILPLKLKQFYGEGVFVVNRDDVPLIDALQPDTKLTLILRAEKSGLQELSTVVSGLISRCGRLNLVMLDIGSYSVNELDEYNNQLARIKKTLLERINGGRPVEVNVLTDRLLLTAMNNCGAGIIHCTVGGNGKFFICPGFYLADENDSIGSIDDGIMIKNRRLLEPENAPICSICDAYHCKRCVYLNSTLTLEINTPSRQQCVASHLERNCSRLLRDGLVRRTPDDTAFAPIPELSYFDPLDVLLRGERRITKKTGNSLRTISCQ
jgi:CXXX repeat peptide maturase